MNEIKELVKELINHNESIDKFSVTYSDSLTISGVISSIDPNFHSTKITLCKSVVPKGADPHVILDFKRIESVVIEYHESTGFENKIFY